MNQGHSIGLFLMIGAALELLLFIYGATRRSYLALALPITAAMLALSALTFWLGWTMLNMEDEEEEPSQPPTLAT
ncbi:MAG: hypothetical protein GEU75_14740 [Dehalococcoidia bacterium]|nr:hypothetical protein [Dehalococcoidia bacterium]